MFALPCLILNKLSLTAAPGLMGVAPGRDVITCPPYKTEYYFILNTLQLGCCICFEFLYYKLKRSHKQI